MKKILATMLVLSLLLAACASPAPAGGGGAAAPAAPPAAGGTAETPAAGGGDDLNWPTRTITLVCPYSPGGGNDFTSRLVARHFTEQGFGNMIVTNITGSAGLIGSQHVMDSPPDGYTLIFNDANTDMQYAGGLTDFSVEVWESFFIVGTSDFASLQVTRWDTLEEVLEYAHSNPGSLRFGMGTGTNTEMAAAAFFQEFDIDGRLIDVGDTGDQLAALAGGHVDMIHIPVGTSRDFRATGEFKVVAFLRTERHPDAEFADVPTLIEMGAPDWLHMPRYFYIGFPAGTDHAIIDRFGEQLEYIVNLPAFIESMEGMELTANFMDQEAAMAYVQLTHEVWVEFGNAVRNITGRG